MRACLAERAAAPTAKLLATRGLVIGYQPVAAPAVPSRLKVLLAPQEQAGDLKVEEFGKRTVVTLRAPECSERQCARGTRSRGAVRLDRPRARGRCREASWSSVTPTISRCGRFRYADNIELSRARAIAVAQLLKPALSNLSRVEWSGVGSTQPRYLSRRRLPKIARATAASKSSTSPSRPWQHPTVSEIALAC